MKCDRVPEIRAVVLVICCNGRGATRLCFTRVFFQRMQYNKVLSQLTKRGLFKTRKA